MEESNGSVEFICTVICGHCEKKEVKTQKGKRNSFCLSEFAYITEDDEDIWRYNSFGYDVICKECVDKIKECAPKPKYKPGCRFVCSDGVIGIVEFVYEFGRFSENKQSYGYSCHQGDGIIEEDEMQTYEGNMKDKEISPLQNEFEKESPIL